MHATDKVHSIMEILRLVRFDVLMRGAQAAVRDRFCIAAGLLPLAVAVHLPAVHHHTHQNPRQEVVAYEHPYQ